MNNEMFNKYYNSKSEYFEFWEFYTNEQKYLKEAGIDGDLVSALQFNTPEVNGFELFDIKKVIAVIEGERDGSSWYWVMELEDGTYGYMEGWCDYTGWDCRSGIAQHKENNLEEILDYLTSDNEVPTGVGSELVQQVESGNKARTWREQHDEEFLST